MPLVAGRDFQAGDRPGTQPVIIIGQGMARTFWPGRNAIGRYVQHGSGRDARSLLVIGVARDPKFGSFVDGSAGLYAYLPLHHQPVIEGWPLLIAARSTHGGRLTGEIRGVIDSIAPNLPIVSAQTAEEYAALGLVPQRLAASVSGTLGTVGLLLPGFGVYGLTAYTVACRTREIGIRLALGAQRADVVAMVLRHGMRLTAIGGTVGLALAIAAGHLVAGLLFGVSPTDPITLAGAFALFTAIGLTASYAPVRRATRSAAIEALRHD